MENQNFDKLLIMSGVLNENKEDVESEPQLNQHNKENIIPPVGIAHPDLLESFTENPEDEQRILQDVKDLEEYHRENKLKSAERNVKSFGLRALEGLGGSLGGVLNALSGEAYFDDSGEMLKGEVPMLPNTQKLREFTKKQTGKKYEPKSEFEKNAQEFATDVGSASAFPISFATNILAPLGGQTTKAIAKHQGATESQADMAKLAFMGMATMASLGNAPQMARNAYNEAVNMIPRNTRMASNVIERGLNNLRGQPWFRTGRTTAKGPALDEMQRIENAIQHGSLDVHDAMQIRRDINEAKKKLGAFNYEPGIDKAQARRHLDDVDQVMREGLEHYGQANNPEWLRNYERANQAYAVTQRSRQLQDYIGSNPITRSLQSQTAKTLFHLGGASALTQVPSIAAATLPAIGAAKGIQIINRMIRSPVLRNHYAQVLSMASAQNHKGLEKALKSFDKEAMKFENQKSDSPNRVSQMKPPKTHPNANSNNGI